MPKKEDNKIIIFALIALALALYFGKMGAVYPAPFCSQANLVNYIQTYSGTNEELLSHLNAYCNAFPPQTGFEAYNTTWIQATSSYKAANDSWYTECIVLDENGGTGKLLFETDFFLNKTVISISTHFGQNVTCPTNYTFVSSCAENWSCGNWSACTNDTKTRTCTDLNSCGTIINKPNTTQSCQQCSPNWNCTDWSSCSDNEQIRTCTDTNNCGNVTGKSPEWQQCTQQLNCEQYGYSSALMSGYDCSLTNVQGITCWSCKPQNSIYQYAYLVFIPIIIIGIIIYWKKFR